MKGKYKSTSIAEKKHSANEVILTKLLR